jgi:hypothetical protein
MKYTVEMVSDGMIIRIKFHEDLFGHSGNINVITSTIYEAALLVLLMGWIYDVCRRDDLRCYDIYFRSFMAIGSIIRVILKVLPQQLERLQYWYC